MWCIVASVELRPTTPPCVNLYANVVHVYMRHGVRATKLRFREIPIMNGDVIASGNFLFSPIYRDTPMQLPRKFTKNNVCHLNGHYSWVL